MTTCMGNHQLVVITSEPQGAGIEEVIRWCEECGAITWDVDADGRTNPGAIMKMRLPKLEARKQGQPKEEGR